jgi:N-methylhydantoinase A
VLPQLGEYARASTAAANAYTRPLVRSYVADLKERISSRLRSADLSLVVSTGRVAPAGTAVGVPIRLVESGPAGGVLAAAATARSIGVGNALAFDMGGTTAKAAYITNGEPRHTDTFEVARVNRFVKGSGLPIQVPSIELVEIGAGGGSVAWVDRLGLLRVGPRSSGSEPGPACYGSGGTEPTVTDADLILGYLDSGSFLGGTMSLDTEAAVEALSALAQVIGLKDPVEAAQAVRRVVDEQMAAAARMHAIEQGLDPTQYTLVATGGAGPLHAFSVARILRSGRMVSPARAGVASAHGFLGAPFGFDVARSAPGMLADMDWHRVLDLLDELENEARQKVGRIDGTRRIEADLRYRGQGATVTISVPADLEPGSAAAGLQHELEAEYRRRYGRVPDGVEPEILTWRLSYSSEPPQVFPAPTDGARQETSRRVWFEEAGEYLPTRVVGRADADGIGPMIIEERESTLVVPPGATVELLAHAVVAVSL